MLPAICLENHCNAGQYHRQRKPLPHADDFRDTKDAGVRLAEVFGDEAETAVADEEYAGNRSPRAGFARKNPQDDEQQQSFQPGLVELRWVARLQIHGLGKNHRPWQRGVADASP